MNTEPAIYLISGELLQAIGDYLAERPWKEVCQVMPVLQNLERYKPEAEKTQAPSND